MLCYVRLFCEALLHEFAEGFFAGDGKLAVFLRRGVRGLELVFDQFAVGEVFGGVGSPALFFGGGVGEIAGRAARGDLIGEERRGDPGAAADVVVES